jgi:adenine deaminase
LAVDGHAPGVTGIDLETYAAAGIETDHECTTPDEAGEKLRLGMFIQMRQGSSAHNLAPLLPLVKPSWSGRLMFATDDKNPVDLLEKGHLDEHLRICVAKGVPPGEAVRLATLNPARHYRLSGLGSLAPGSKADLAFFRDLKSFETSRVLIAGKTVYENGEFREDWKGPEGVASSSMHLKEINSDVLRVKRGGDIMKVIKIEPGQLVTQMEYVTVPAAEEVVSDTNTDILKIAVFERHHGTGNVGVGFVRGLGLKSGAFATTVAHDSHHLIVTGTNDADILKAARECAAMKGGVAVVSEGVLLATLPLPLFGLMSDKPFAGVTRGFREVHDALKRLGSPLPDPLMQVSFLALPVIPALKITDKGLVDVDLFKHVPLFGE